MSNLYWQTADGTGTVERLTTSPNIQNPEVVTPDGAQLVFRENAPRTGQDLRVLRLDPASTPARPSQPLIQTPFAEMNADLSPDGRWLAYESNESGAPQVYVRPFPDVGGGRWQVSTGDGSRTPKWARNGHEIFFMSNGGYLWSVPVQTTPTFRAGTGARVFERPYLTTFGLSRVYDAAPDGQRFLMIKDPVVAAGQSAPASIVVVLHWTEELKEKVKTEK